jgi:hypothetical protein
MVGDGSSGGHQQEDTPGSAGIITKCCGSVHCAGGTTIAPRYPDRAVAKDLEARGENAAGTVAVAGRPGTMR